MNDKPLESPNPIENPNQIEAEVVENYDAAELETRREDDHPNAPADQELAPPEPNESLELRGEHEAEGERRPSRRRRPPVRFGIDEFAGANSNPNQSNTIKTFFPRYTY